MKKIELIICLEGGAWFPNTVVEIPEYLYFLRNKEAIIDWLIKNSVLSGMEGIAYIGVYSWNP